MIRARDLYLRCVDAEPNYAPAWACLGRAHRFIGKYREDLAEDFGRAEKAFRKAFALNPNLALAHNFYTLQTRVRAFMLRLKRYRDIALSIHSESRASSNRKCSAAWEDRVVAKSFIRRI